MYQWYKRYFPLYVSKNVFSLLQGFDCFVLYFIRCLGIDIQSGLNVRMSHNLLDRLDVRFTLSQPGAERVPHMVT